MERKRRLPARAARVESASKKRTSTPPEQRNQTPPTPTAPPPAVEESLPKSIAAGKPLPTLDEQQPDNLSSKEFQSISERCAFSPRMLSHSKKYTDPCAATVEFLQSHYNDHEQNGSARASSRNIGRSQRRRRALQI
jgi:hypothetical protein